MNLFNLNNHIEIPLFAKKERGVNFYAKLVWDLSDSLRIVQNPPGSPPGQHFELGYSRLATPTEVYYNSHLLGSQSCTSAFPGQAVTSYFDSIVDQNNTVRPLPYNTNVMTGQGCGAGSYTVATQDGQWLLTVTYTNQNCWGENCITSVTETDPLGNVYSGGTLTDPNGNQISRTSSGWTDPTGNTVFTVPSSTTYSYPVQTGPMANVQFNSSAFTLQNQFTTCNPGYATTNTPLTTSIALPDGSSYAFTYESANGTYPSTTVTGRIHSITIPAGATYTYTYSGGTNGINCDGTPAILTITGSDGSVWTYNRTVSNCLSNCTGPYVTTVVTDPACNDAVYSFDAGGRQVQVQNYQGTAGTPACSATSRTLLQTVTTCYDGNFTNCTAPSSVLNCTGGTIVCRADKYTYLPGLAQPSLSETFYNSNELVTQQNEFDFGVNTGSAPTTTPLRATITSYANVGNHILNRPACVQVSGGTSPACGTVTSTTKSLTNFSNYDSHGNVGTIQEWVSGTTYISSGLTYFSTGLVNTATDFKGTPTTYTYGNCNNSYPTQTTKAGLSQYFTWDCNGGVVTSTKDANGKTTSYSYTNPNSGVGDPFWRLTQTTYPDGGKFTTTFNDTASPVNITTTQLIDTSGHAITTQTNFDAFGRPVQTALTSDPDGATYSVTTYDLLGRQSRVYNPTRCSTPTTNCGESTWGYSTYAYDALGRTTQVTRQDGQIVSTTYSANCSTVTDEAGKARKSCSDALGRLTQVFEDPAILNYETDYTYDALDNLLSVNQKGGSTNSALWRTRTFAYDGLSRLTSASNPESGTATYGYDANGNLTSKTSPAPNQTGTATVTLSYCYDALNRLTAKAYTAQSCPMSSPIATYLYDQTSYNGLTIANGIGRRTGMIDQAGSEAWSYDSMGRIANDQRTTNGVTLQTPYTYNLDGSLATITYPDLHNPLTVTFQPGGAGRPVGESSNDATYAYSVHYASNGALCFLQQGWGNTTTMNRTFNNRFQPVRIYESGDPTTPPTPCTTPTQSTTLPMDFTYAYLDANGHNNGNVASITRVGDTDSTQNFTYDSLNRIATAQTSAINQPDFQGDTGYLQECWAEQYSYDPWGNLVSIAPSSSSNYIGCSQESGFNFNGAISTKNQIVAAGYAYDSAGNLIAAPPTGTAYVYDAENHLTAAAGQTYLYDGDGKRVEKATTGPPLAANKLYWYDQSGNAIYETDPSGNELYRYYRFAGLLVAREEYNDWVDHYGLDALGSVRWVYGTNNVYPNYTVNWDVSDYYPFGAERVIQSNSNNDRKFTGKERDTESGNDNFAARFYSSSMGRFLSPDPSAIDLADPLDPQQLNLYSYTRNNPINATDPSGLNCVWDDGSYDAEDDPATGTQKGCEAQGGTWVQYERGDWNPNANGDLAAIVESEQNNIASAVVNANDPTNENPYISEISRQLAPLNKLSDCTGQAIANEVPLGRQVLGASSPDNAGKASRFVAKATSSNSEGKLINLPATDAPGLVTWNYATNSRRVTAALDKVDLPVIAEKAASASATFSKLAPAFSKWAGIVGWAYTAGNAAHNTYACYNKP